jgi:osmotically inducible protein OsmC
MRTLNYPPYYQVGDIPNITEEKFIELANAAKKNCPVSKALDAIDITLSALLK